MIDRYLEKGTMYVLEDGDVKAECVVTEEIQMNILFCRLEQVIVH